MTEIETESLELMEVEVRSKGIELRGGTRAKRGDIIRVPADETHQSPTVRWGLQTGNLVRVTTTIDLPPVTSTEIPEE